MLFDKKAPRPENDPEEAHADKELVGTVSKSELRRKSAMEKEWEGYTEVKELDRSGRMVIRRVYIGKTYAPQESKGMHMLRKFCYTAAFIGAFLLYYYSASNLTLANFLVYVSVLHVITALCLLWVFYVLIINYLPEKAPLTVNAYRSGHKPLVYSGACAAIAALVVVVALFLGMLQLGLGFGEVLPAIWRMALAAVLLGGIASTEQRLTYEEQPGKE